MATIRNITGEGGLEPRVIHLVAGVSHPDVTGKTNTTYLQLPGHKAPGVPPGSYEIDNIVAAFIQKHPTNAMFLDSIIKIEMGDSKVDPPSNKKR